jgi:osmotically inducible lipoprotein OsmB
MNTRLHIPTRCLAAVATLTMVIGLSACGNMSQQDKNTAIGAGVGAIGGSVLTGGSTMGTIGGAAVGGVIGNQVDTNKK